MLRCTICGAATFAGPTESWVRKRRIADFPVMVLLYDSAEVRPRVQVLSKAEIKESLAAFGEFGRERVQFDGQGLFYVHSEADCIDLEYPTKLERLPSFTRLLATLGYDDSDFAGARFCFTTWGVWNPQDEAIGYRIVEAFNRAAGQPRSFEVAPGRVFRADELVDAVALLMQPMVIGWDAYYLPQWSFGVEEFFLHISHDGFLTVVTRTTSFHEIAFSEIVD